MKISSSPTWPIICFKSLRRSEARVLKPSEGSVEGSGNQVLNLWAKARALKRASFREGSREL